jgi:thioredoxin-dependent peroxiredoxin
MASVPTSVPNVVFKARVRDASLEGPNPFAWKDVTSEDLFAGKRVVLFALPGAFTPTCSSTHLPGYERDYNTIRSLGVDDVYCLSVNDAFVMRQWGLAQGLPEEFADSSNPLNPGNFQHVKLLPDGACLFTRGMGMSCTWDSERGFGERSWRYSAVINNGTIEKMFVEVSLFFSLSLHSDYALLTFLSLSLFESQGGAVTQNSGPDPFEVSDSATMVAYLQEQAAKK